MDMDPTNATGNSSDDDDEYVNIALIVGIPFGLIILVLVTLTIVMCYLTLKSSDNHESETVYRQRRFKGLSLEEQREMARAKRKSFLPKKITSRRKSSGAARQLQGLHAAAVPSRNPFKLQEWQLRMSGIGVRGSSAGSGDPETDETEVEEEGYEARKTSYGAINPLMMEDEEDSRPGYEEPSREPEDGVASEESSSDSFNPYD